MEVSSVSQVKFVMFVSGPHGTQCFTSQVCDVPGPHQIFVNCLLHIQKARFCLHDQVQCYTIWYLVSFQALIRFLSVACSAESRVWIWGYATSSHYKKNRSQESKPCRMFKPGYNSGQLWLLLTETRSRSVVCVTCSLHG